MERVLFTFDIRPGTEDEYQRRHDEIWPELVDVIKDAGVANYTIFRRGTEIFLYLEAHPDRETAFSTMGASDVNARWSDWFSDIIVDMTDQDGQLRFAEEVWHLD